MGQIRPGIKNARQVRHMVAGVGTGGGVHKERNVMYVPVKAQKPRASSEYDDCPKRHCCVRRNRRTLVAYLQYDITGCWVTRCNDSTSDLRCPHDTSGMATLFEHPIAPSNRAIIVYTPRSWSCRRFCVSGLCSLGGLRASLSTAFINAIANIALVRGPHLE